MVHVAAPAPKCALVLALCSAALVCWVSTPEAVRESTGAIHGLAVKSGTVHANIVNFKAFCIGAQRKIAEMIDHQHSSVIPFVHAFGKNATQNNIIDEYAKLYASTSNDFDSGMGQYLLDHLNTALLTGKGMVVMKEVGSNHYILDWKALGLETLPQYLGELKVPIHEYSAAQKKVQELNNNADTFAAVEYLRSEHNNAYVSFLDQEIAKVEAIKAAHKQAFHEAAFHAEQDAYSAAVEVDDAATLKHVAVQPRAGVDAAQAASDGTGYVEPAPAELERRAQVAAEAYMESLKKGVADTAGVIKNAEEMNMGVTISMTTSVKDSARSAQQPTVFIKGTKGELTSKLDAVPLPGETLVQTLPSDHLIGDIQSVELSASSTDSWMCSEFKAKIGEDSPWVHMQQKNFWLETSDAAGTDHEGFDVGHSLTLTPLGAEPAEAPTDPVA